MTGPGERLGIGVVGCGPWGSNHVRVWSGMGHLRAVCDADPGLARETATSFNVVHATSFDELLSLSAVSAIVVATPAATHADLALQALEAGKDVLVEKPLALSVADGEKLAEVAAECGAVLMVDHLLEYHPAVERLRHLVATGALGRVRYVYSHRLNFGRVRTEENALWSFAPHDIALIHSLLGVDPDVVACHGAGFLNRQVADVTLMALEFPGDVRAHVFVSWLHPFKEHRFVVVGEREMAVFDDTAPWSEKLLRYPHRVDWVDGRIPVASRADAIAEPLDELEPLSAACAHFVECVRERREPRTGAASGLAVLRVLEAGDRSLTGGGKPVPTWEPVSGSVFVHPTATVDSGAELGSGSRVWHYAHVMSGARVGRDCTLGQNVFVGRDTRIGDRVKIQNNVSVYEGVELEDDVFCGPSAVFTNVINPRAEVERRAEFSATLVRTGATIGANATVVCGNTVGGYAMVGAGAVVTHDVPDHALVVGVPARRVGWVSHAGEILGPDLVCPRTGRRYRQVGEDRLEEIAT